MRRWARFVFAATLPLAFGCDLGVGDQICTEDSIDRDKDDACPYGAPGGPKVNVDTTTDGCQDLPKPEDAPAVCPTWDEVWARFVAADGGRCSNAGCHGDPGNSGYGIYLPIDDAAASYDTLSAYERDGQPYIRDAITEPGPAKSAWLLCNIQGKKGGYAPMPKPNGLSGAKKEADLQLVRDWVNCGMRKTGGGTGPGGGGGVGGGGGEGGLGGVGGDGGGL